MKGFLGWKLMAVGIALVLLSGSAGAGSVEKNGISVELLENKRISAFAGIAVVNITAKKNYDFKITDLLAVFKKFDLNSPEKGVYSDAKPVLWQVLEEFNYSNSVIRFVGNGTFLNATDSLTNKTSLQEQLVAKNFSYWHYAFREVTDKTKFKLKNGESIKLKFVGDLLKPKTNYDWILGIDGNEWEEFAWWNATSTAKREITYTHNAFLATNLIDYPLFVNATTADYDCKGQDFSNTGDSASIPSSFHANCTPYSYTYVQVANLSSVNQSTYWYKNMSVVTANYTDDFATWNNSFEGVYLLNGNNYLKSRGGRANDLIPNANVPNVTGRIGNAINFTGLFDELNLTTIVDNLTATWNSNAFAVKAWAKSYSIPIDGSDGGHLLACRNNPSNGIWAFFGGQQATTCPNGMSAIHQPTAGSGSGLVTACGGTTITNGVWHYYVWSWDGSNIRQYLDGKLESTTAITTAGNFYSFSKCTIGNDAWLSGSSPFRGDINSVMILNRTVSWDEVLADYNSTQLAFGAETLNVVADTTVPNASIIFPANNTNSSGMNSTSGLLNVSISVNDNVGLSGINATILYTNATGGLQRSMGNQSAVPNNSITYLTRVFPANTDSQFRWLVEVSDNATTPNVVNSSLNFITIDNVNPSSFTFVGVTPGNATNVSSASQTFNFTFNETHMNSGALGTCIVSYNQSVNSTPFIPVAGNSSNCGLTNSSLIAGSQFVVAYANDSMGNWGVSGARHFLVDTVAPSITSLTTYPANNSFFNATFNASFEATVTDTTSGRNRTLIQVDGVNYTAYSPSVDVFRFALNNVLSGAAPDPHSWSAYAEDYSGNWAWSGNQSYSIQRGITSMNLSINRQNLNVSLTYAQSTNQNITTEVNTTTGQTVSIYENSTLATTGTDFRNWIIAFAGGARRFLANTTQTANWTSAESVYRQLTIGQLNPNLQLYLNATNLNLTYYSDLLGDQINATWTHSAGTQGAIDFYLNDTVLSTNPNYANFSQNTVADWNYTSIFNATANYSRNEVTWWAKISNSRPGGGLGGGGGGGISVLPTIQPVIESINNTTGLPPVPLGVPFDADSLKNFGLFALGALVLVQFARGRVR